MTDNEIIEIFRHCNSADCNDCYNCSAHKDGECAVSNLGELVLQVVDKQKAILEAIDDEMFPLPFETDFDKAIKAAKNEAIKEFAEKVKRNFCINENGHKMVDVICIDNLVKEMTEVGE